MRDPRARVMTAAIVLGLACASCRTPPAQKDDAPKSSAAPKEQQEPKAHQATGPLVYVSDEIGGKIVVVDANPPSEARVVATIDVGKRPRGIKLSRDGKLLYVAVTGSPQGGPNVDESKLPPRDFAADGIGVVDLATQKLVRVLKSGQDPETFDVSPDGKTLYVSNEETAEMSVLDLASGDVRAKVTVGREPEGVTVSPDGKTVYVTSEEDGEVTAVDTTTLKVKAHLPTAKRPRVVIFAKDGVTAFVTDEIGGMVTVLDTAAMKPLESIKITHAAAVSTATTAPRPMGAALSPDGSLLYVACGRGGSVAVIDVATRKQIRSIDGVGERPWGIATSPDGTKLFTANGPGKDMSIVDVATGKVDKRIPIGVSPWGLIMGR